MLRSRLRDRRSRLCRRSRASNRHTCTAPSPRQWQSRPWKTPCWALSNRYSTRSVRGRQTEISPVTTEHVGTDLIRSHLSRLVHVCPEPLRAERVVVACAPGELHDVGALAVALFLRRRGFDVVFVGANPEPECLVRDVERLQGHAV